jgi:hypothetical protein
MYEEGGYLTDTKETSTSYITHLLVQNHMGTYLATAILPTGTALPYGRQKKQKDYRVLKSAN